MPRRPPPHSRYQTVLDFDAPDPEPPPPASPNVAEPEAPGYRITTAWIDTAGRTRTWALCNTHGIQMAEITRKSAALKLAALLNGIHGNEINSDECSPSR